MANPLKIARDALNELLQMNDRTKGKTIKNTYLGKDILIMVLGENRIIEGDWEDISVDVTDLMDAWQQENS